MLLPNGPAQGKAEPDPTRAAVSALQAAGTEEELSQALFPDSVFQGLQSSGELEGTVISWLEDIYQDTRTHLEIAADVQFDARNLTP